MFAGCAALLVVALAACSGPAPVAAPSSTASSGATNGGTASPSPTGPPTITLDFAGDVHFTGRTLTLLDDPATAFGPGMTAELSAADIAMVNLESAVTTGGTPEPKQFHFRAPATAYQAIKAAGIDVITLANNHTLDYGRVGLTDTLNYAKAANLPIVGAGENADEAYQAWVANVKGVRIAFLGMSQISELASSWAATDSRSGLAMAFDTSRALAAVKAAKAQADVVVVFMHWGEEYNKCPTSEQQTFAKQLADAGANIIIGSHVHLLQGDGWIGDTFVAYGMSNFLWWLNDAATNDTGVMQVTLTGTKVTGTQFLPAYINRTTGQPDPVTGAEATRISSEYAALRSCTGLADNPS